MKVLFYTAVALAALASTSSAILLESADADHQATDYHFSELSAESYSLAEPVSTETGSGESAKPGDKPLAGKNPKAQEPAKKDTAKQGAAPPKKGAANASSDKAPEKATSKQAKAKDDIVQNARDKDALSKGSDQVSSSVSKAQGAKDGAVGGGVMQNTAAKKDTSTMTKAGAQAKEQNEKPVSKDQVQKIVDEGKARVNEVALGFLKQLDAVKSSKDLLPKKAAKEVEKNATPSKDAASDKSAPEKTTPSEDSAKKDTPAGNDATGNDTSGKNDAPAKNTPANAVVSGKSGQIEQKAGAKGDSTPTGGAPKTAKDAANKADKDANKVAETSVDPKAKAQKAQKAPIVQEKTPAMGGPKQVEATAKPNGSADNMPKAPGANGKPKEDLSKNSTNVGNEKKFQTDSEKSSPNDGI